MPSHLPRHNAIICGLDPLFDCDVTLPIPNPSQSLAYLRAAPLPLERAAKDKAKGTKSGRGTHPLPLLFGYCLENMAPLSEGVIGKGPSSPWLAGAHLIDKLLDSNHPCHKVLTEGRYAPLEVRSGHGCLKSMDHQQHGARPLARCHRSIFDHHRSWDDL